VLFAFVKIWTPKTIRRFGGAELAPADASNPEATISSRQAFSAWLPYIVLIAVVVAWTGPWSRLPAKGLFRLSVGARSSVTHEPIASTFNFTPLGGGTSIFASWLLILALIRPKVAVIKGVFARTFQQMWGALLVAFFVFALAYAFVYSGMANSLAFGFSKGGLLFVALAPILGWIGVALSGSNTSTNAMFGPVQAVTGRLLNLPVLLLPSVNSLGAEVGKPIAPQTASVGVATSRLVRSEGAVIRHNMGWTLILLGYLVLISLLFYFFLPRSMSL
jgi:lactate permease